MRTLGLASLFVACALAGSAARADDKKDQEALQGTWNVVSLEREGKSTPEAELKGRTITIAGTKFTLPGGKGFTKSEANTFKLDSSKKPATIDLTPEAGESKGKAFPGIYTIEGDTFMACYDSTGKARPTAFSAKAGSGHVLIVYKKAK